MRNAIWASLFLTALTLSFAAPAAAKSPWSELDTPQLTKTCKYFENRARFLTRGPGISLSALLADSCSQALHRFVGQAGTSPYEAKRARIYLERLTDFKATIIAMNTEAFVLARQSRPQQLGSPARIEVSLSGEYLIARQMGVLTKFNEWARVSNFELALR